MTGRGAQKAEAIKLVVLDVDGVMTDGTLTYASAAESESNGRFLELFLLSSFYRIQSLRSHGQRSLRLRDENPATEMDMPSPSSQSGGSSSKVARGDGGAAVDAATSTRACAVSVGIADKMS